MTEKNNNIIQPKAVPLSHLTDDESGPRLNIDRRNLSVGAVVVIALLVAVVGANYFMVDTPVSSSTKQLPTASSNAKSNNDNTQLAPFAQSQKELTRAKAQDALAEFVELQLQLQDELQVTNWGQDNYNKAMALAEVGDAEFVGEKYEASLTTYNQATTLLRNLVEQADDEVKTLVEQTLIHINNLNHQQALDSVQAAVAIKPNSNELIALKQRVDNLPQLITLLRDARNHELGNRPKAALAAYEEITKLDPQYTAVQDHKDKAAQLQVQLNINQYLSDGFNLLEQQKFDDARNAFNQAIKLSPNNEVALGGLAAVAERNDLNIISQHRTLAEQALDEERWQDAIDEYETILKLDANIQFAKSGLRVAKAHNNLSNLLSKILESPQKLSNEKLYLEANDIAKRSAALSRTGPNLTKKLGEVQHLLTLYRDPVDVILLSDNATDIIISNVGRIGTFQQKSLKLRPGQYTIRGSQHGCRDIYLSVEVLPGIEPLDLSCPEKL